MEFSHRRKISRNLKILHLLFSTALTSKERKTCFITLFVGVEREKRRAYSFSQKEMFLTAQVLTFPFNWVINK